MFSDKCKHIIQTKGTKKKNQKKIQLYQRRINMYNMRYINLIYNYVSSVILIMSNLAAFVHFQEIKTIDNAYAMPNFLCWSVCIV